jgi:hypothetical protein
MMTGPGVVLLTVAAVVVVFFAIKNRQGPGL